MPIKQITTQSQINEMIEKDMQKVEKAIIYQMKYIGEMAYIAMRDYSGRAYTDQTGNLRASSGYVIVKDGEIVKKGKFQSVKGSNKGPKQGKQFAESLASKFPKGLTLVLVAGMEYAFSVHGKGYNVLDSAQLTADKLVKELIDKLKKRK